ncbi:MAG: M20/M25/M40 family metallo-hydrolase [Hyphomicrobiaceae bacterium]
MNGLLGNAVEHLFRLIGAGRNGEAAIRAMTQTAMEAIGCEVQELVYDPRDVPLIEEFAIRDAGTGTLQSCLIGRLRGTGGGRSLILFAHPDTEPFDGSMNWSHDPFTPLELDGRLYGWGVADDLAGLSLLTESPKALLADGFVLAGDLFLVSAPSKRHRRGIAAALHDGLTADAAVYLHPAESGNGLNEIKAFAPGQLEFFITVSGRLPETNEPAHTAFAHTGVNAFEKLILIAASLKDFDSARGARVRQPSIESVIGRSTNLMLSHCEFGARDRLSRMPASGRLGGVLSLVPGEGLENVKSEVADWVTAACASDPWLSIHPPTINWVAGVSAAETPEDAPIYEVVANTLTSVGARPCVNPLHVSSDIRNPIVQKGISTVGFGPLCGNLTVSGGVNEWVDIADFTRSVQVTKAVIASWCGSSRA